MNALRRAVVTAILTFLDADDEQAGFVAISDLLVRPLSRARFATPENEKIRARLLVLLQGRHAGEPFSQRVHGLVDHERIEICGLVRALDLALEALEAASTNNADGTR